MPSTALGASVVAVYGPVSDSVSPSKSVPRCVSPPVQPRLGLSGRARRRLRRCVPPVVSARCFSSAPLAVCAISALRVRTCVGAPFHASHTGASTLTALRLSAWACKQVEHLLYFSVVLIHFVVPSHPIHFFFNMQHTALTPVKYPPPRSFCFCILP